MNRYRRKVDQNQKEITEKLRQIGASVEPKLSRVGQGVPDLLVGYQGKNYLFELKAGNGKLTPAEESYIDNWRGEIHIIRTWEEAFQIVGA